MNTLRGRRALVTGASSGLGADFARNLAGRGCHLILVARREEQLRTLAQELTARHGVEVDVIPMNLVERDAPQLVYDQIKASGRVVDVLINNAGLGLHGQFLDIPWERERAMLELDMLVLVHMTKLFVKDMVARRYGYIMQIASNGAFQPTPTYATYSAAKSFVLSFGEAIHYELRDTGVKVIVVAPGVTRTEFLQVAGQRPTLYQRTLAMDSPDVVDRAIQAMLRGQSCTVPGFANWFLAWSTRFMPRQLAAAIANQTMTRG